MYTVDETDLFYKCVAKKTFTFHGQSASRAVESKQHLTLRLGANMDASDKLEPLVIGNPRCFRGVPSLPVPYKSNAKAWMDDHHNLDGMASEV